MTQQNNSSSKHSNAYNLFIIGLTVFSLIIMIMMLLPLDEEVATLNQKLDVMHEMLKNLQPENTL